MAGVAGIVIIRCADCPRKIRKNSPVHVRCKTCAKVHNRKTHYAAMIKRLGIQKPYSGHKTEGNGSWKGGVSHKYAKRFKKTQCERCPSRRKLEQHHKDRNKRNNDPSNLETLCEGCHKAEHVQIRRKSKWLAETRKAS